MSAGLGPKMKSPSNQGLAKLVINVKYCIFICFFLCVVNYTVINFVYPFQRCHLGKVILQTKKLDIGEPKAILGVALSPPNLDDIERTILVLKEVYAINRIFICNLILRNWRYILY